MSVVFQWNPEEMENRLATCEKDQVFPLIKKYLPKGSRVLESGCGDGRWVKYLQDHGWKVVGLEISKETIDMVKKTWPEIEIIEGDAANSPFKDAQFDGVISLGVVEHWIEGPNQALKDIYRVLKPNGVAIITVPCFSTIRKIKKAIWWNEFVQLPRACAARIIKKKKLCFNRFKKRFKFSVYPTYGKFFEYRMTTDEFLDEINKCGFEIITHQPVASIDGLYHELNLFNMLIKFKNWQFKVSPIAEKLHNILSKKRFFHPHMQGVVVRKRKEAFIKTSINETLQIY